MITETKKLTHIKETKYIEMFGDEKSIYIRFLGDKDIADHGILEVPISKVFSVKRGLESYIQRFYRKRDKLKV